MWYRFMAGVSYRTRATSKESQDYELPLRQMLAYVVD